MTIIYMNNIAVPSFTSKINSLYNLLESATVGQHNILQYSGNRKYFENQVVVSSKVKFQKLGITFNFLMAYHRLIFHKFI